MSDRRVLVVEDDPIIRRFIRDVLKRKGYDIQSCENGLEAMDAIKQREYHLIISDLKMDKMDGLELLARVKKLSPKTEVIIITAYGTVTNAVEAMKKGAFDYIMKPIELEELEIVIDRVFEHRSLVDENQYLKERLNSSNVTQSFIGKSSYSTRVRELIDMVGPLDSTVLIMGETGSGKEVVANAIHQLSQRKDRPYIKVNCAALPDTLLESELFGHEKGAFTGAVQRTKGRFELADTGTLLLDEIGELGLQVQAKLLRALQYQQFERVGSGKQVDVDVRVIATTNRNLKEEVKRGTFRKDLFFRLNVVTITLLSLRDRKDDVPFYVEHFLQIFNQKYNKKKSLSDKTMDFLIQYDWPGNVRELENCMETAVILNKGEVLLPEHFVFLEDHRDLLEEDGNFNEITSIAEAEKQLILKTYKKYNYNKTHAAKVLGITIKTLRTKLREYGVVDQT
ncbi:sigma-54-dependent Fis family transcriptional regulator [bacterium]|nr:sigma-54-dependent Fis family transcriptional regulator [bacterium]